MTGCLVTLLRDLKIEKQAKLRYLESDETYRRMSNCNQFITQNIVPRLEKNALQ